MDAVDLLAVICAVLALALSGVLALLCSRALRAARALEDAVEHFNAAAVPAMLGMALAAVRKGYAPGSPVLVEASGDDGACGAAVLHEARGPARRVSAEDRLATGAVR